MKLASADKVAVGDTVYALGTPISQSLEGTFTRGTISAMRDGGALIQTDTAVSPGNSGGPLLNQKGEVIGVIVSGAQDGQNLNFAVNVRHLVDLLKLYDAKALS
jgi:serine protease Do